MKKQTLIRGLDKWLTEKGYKVTLCSEDEVSFLDHEGETHSILLSSVNGNEGAMATNSMYAGQLLQEFSNQFFNGAKLKKSHFSMAHTAEKTPVDIIKDALKNGGSDSGSIQKTLEEQGVKITDVDPRLEMLTASYSKLVEAAEESGNPKYIEEVEKLGSLVEFAKRLSSGEEIPEEIVEQISKMADATSLSKGHREFKRLQHAGKTKPPQPMKEIEVGQMFFDKHYNLNLAVGFEKGLVGGDYVNSVVIQDLGDSDEHFTGLPVKRELDERVIVVEV